ncbi:hypothetical protein C6A77_15215 [Pseudomonas sp. AFG_SD02_1510_Pfu_092]|uniref:hypothetical protein n=1 Tax=Pseudomonas sp. AFG_SD02_1510_Pfu_092 TaxID=2259497 RepID=UPI000DEF82B9|nr:hypothetical protein [Pseudomonas sp. AFG_SD02_1510_Pfu_092]RCL24830.1 hypothetical protein C6A77_15215 [Pseudomonas sp. AFG_SD02_1510_Pfu_092]
MSYKKTAIGLKCYDWSSVDLLKNLSPQTIVGCKKKIEARQQHFWHDMSSEFDSKHFLNYLMKRTDLNLSDEFLEFVCLWHLDEQNHYRGLRKINSVLYNQSENLIDQRIKSRKPDFGSVSTFLRDEFTILLSIAFDEITSTRAYKQDFDLFDSLGPCCLSTWIRYAARDEAAHYGNAMKLLKLHHSCRFEEAPRFLDDIINFETSHRFTYQNTFIFDHDTDDFSLDLLNRSRHTILELLRRPS